MNYKFNEDKLITELQKYVDSTYGEHYSTDKYQATDIIIDSGHGTGFNLGNVIKYAKRYGKKGGPAEQRKDLMKILHYALIQLYVHDEENLHETDHKIKVKNAINSLQAYQRAPYADAPGHSATYYKPRLNDATSEEWSQTNLDFNENK